jgi:hypothetical protein
MDGVEKKGLLLTVFLPQQILSKPLFSKFAVDFAH